MAGSGSSSRCPTAPQSRYLYTLLADNDFQDGLKNYRDLAYLTRTLQHWDDSMDAFGAMIDTRETRLCGATAACRCTAGQRPAERSCAAARQRRPRSWTAIETGNDVAALGTPAEREQWAYSRGASRSALTAHAAGTGPR